MEISKVIRVKSTKPKTPCKNKIPVEQPPVFQQQQPAPDSGAASLLPPPTPPPVPLLLPPPPPLSLPTPHQNPENDSSSSLSSNTPSTTINNNNATLNNLKIVIKKEDDDGISISTPTTTGTTSTGVSTPKSQPKKPSANSASLSNSRDHIHDYLHEVSGQKREKSIQEKEHDYSKPWHTHPDPLVRSRSAKFLFMKYFPRHLSKQKYSQHNDNEIIDIIHPFEEQKKIPFLTPKPPAIPISVDEDYPEIDPMITDQWSCEMNKLWTKATKIIYADRTSRLSFEGNLNEVLLKRNLQEQTANKFRELFSSTFWDFKLVSWLHNTLQEFLDPNYKMVYLDSLQILRHKIPSLIETFYPAPKTENKIKLPSLNDPLFNTLSHYKPKKLSRKPIIIMVPIAPNFVVSESPRMKYWHSLFSAMGKLVTIPIVAKPNDYVSDILTDIRCLVNEKIRNCKSQFSSRPIIVVGFNQGSLIAVSCSLENQNLVSATICLGFPLKGINGIRGELDDPFLETTVPVQFVIGENAIMTSLDDIEDFRERMTKTETALVVVGGADDRLIVSNTKKRLELLTQSLVDRCVADEIYNFLSDILSTYKDGSVEGVPDRISQEVLANLVSMQHASEMAPTATPIKKKKVNRKRLIENGDFANNNNTPATPVLTDPITGAPKPAYKRKRPPSKRPKPIADGCPLNPPHPPPPPPPPFSNNTDVKPPLVFSNQTNLNPSLPVSFPMQQTFPNLTSVLSSFSAPEKSYFDFSSIKSGVDNNKSKIVSSDNNNQNISFSMNQSPQNLKKNLSAKKSAAVNNNSVNNAIFNQFPSINGEKNFAGLIQTMESFSNNNNNNQMVTPGEPKSKLLGLNLSSHISPAISSSPFSSLPPVTSNTASPFSIHLSSQMSHSHPMSSSSHHHFVSNTTAITPMTPTPKDSYTVSEITGLIHQSATRTGRPIKPPKALDI